MREREIFTHALQQPTDAERSAYLDEACGGDEELRRRIEALIRERADLGDFLERPALEPARTESPEGEAGRISEEPTVYESPDEAPREVSLDFLASSEKPGSLGTLGSYEITEVVGHGGMGVVLKGEDTKLNRVVAIKVLAPELASNATARQRFRREAQAAAAVTHPHVVTIHAVEETDRLPYLVMEYVDGLSLRQRIDRDGPLELREILRIGSQIASGLATAHDHGLIHRDVKPANILLENGVERVRVTDFGLARAVDDVHITQTGEVAGTPQSMSPEQAQGERVDHRSDLFSLGSALYAMCTGRSPFRAETTVATLRRVCDDTPRPIREINPEIPAWLVEIVEKLLAKNPDERFQSAEEVAELLGRHLAELQYPSAAQQPRMDVRGSSSAANPLEVPKRRRRRLWMTAAVALIVLLGGLGLTEATGVTRVSQFVATVLRIKTPEGTLVVKVDDPNVEVAIEGDGGLVITGAGPQQVRLEPGQYRLKATKDGQPVHQQLVTISRGGKEVVDVTLEGEAETPAAARRAERDAFVLLGGEGVAERRFDTLSEAVLKSSPGDTIEIRGDGPFVSEPVQVNHRLRIRVADAYAPVIRLDPDGNPDRGQILLWANAPLVLEGLTLQRPPKESSGVLLANGQADVHATNCRFFVANGPCAGLYPNTVLRNCELFGRVQLPLESNTQCAIENCVVFGSVNVHAEGPDFPHVSIRLDHNTLVSPYEAIATHFVRKTKPNQMNGREAARIHIEARHNIIHSPVAAFLSTENPQDDSNTQGELTGQLVQWNGERNLYARKPQLLIAKKGQQRRSVDDWAGFWDLENSDFMQGQVRYRGGDLLARIRSSPEDLTAEDFRLRRDSAGYQAGPDGEDLGANIDFVGPGDAYERFKETPEYQEWLKETNELIGAEDKNASADYRSVPTGVITEVRRFEGHTKWVTGLDISPDGTRAVSCQKPDDKGPPIRLWDTATGELLQRFGNQVEYVNSVAFSPDGRTVAVGIFQPGAGGGVQLWDLDTFEIVRTFGGHERYVGAVAFSPDGRRLASAGSMDETLRIRDVESGEELHRCQAVGEERRWVTDVRFASDGNSLLAAHTDNGAILWDPQTGERIRRFRDEDTDAPFAVALSPDGSLAAAGGQGAGLSIRLWDTESGERIGYLPGHERIIHSLRFTSDGRHLISGALDGTLRVWEVATQREVARIECPSHATNYLEISPDGRHVLSAGGWDFHDGGHSGDGDYALRLWRLPEVVRPQSRNEINDASRPASEPPAPPLPEQRGAEN